MKIASIFRTLDGEVSHGGPLQWATFIRLGGCNLRCWKSRGYCDAPHTLKLDYPYEEYTVGQLLDYCTGPDGCKRVTITGGEPLLQRTGVLQLAEVLRGRGQSVTLETSGAECMHSPEIKAFACVVMDLKVPSTEMSTRMHFNNLERLREQDFLKVVIENREDFDWALDVIAQWKPKAQIAFGPRYGHLEPRVLVHWLEQIKRWDIRLNLQLHKEIWPECGQILSFNKEEQLSLGEVTRAELINGER